MTSEPLDIIVLYERTLFVEFYFLFLFVVYSTIHNILIYWGILFVPMAVASER